jgi:hypothetical protein
VAPRNGRQHGTEVGASRLVVWSPEEARGYARSVVLRWAEGDDRAEDRLRRAEVQRAKLLDRTVPQALTRRSAARIPQFTRHALFAESSRL